MSDRFGTLYIKGLKPAFRYFAERLFHSHAIILAFMISWISTIVLLQLPVAHDSSLFYTANILVCLTICEYWELGIAIIAD